MLSDVISKSYDELKRLKTEVGGRKGRHKPATQSRKPKRDLLTYISYMQN